MSYTHMKLHDRLRSYLDRTAMSQSEVAQVLGLQVRKFNYYLTEKSQVNLWPLLPKLLKNDSKLSRDWLYFGEGEMFCTPQNNQCPNPALPLCGRELGQALASSAHSSAAEAPQMGALDSPIRLTGLTECGEQGWFSRAFRAVNVSPPRCSGQWIAVQAMGDSMVPHGIMEGYTLFCDPSQPPAEGEAVYALRRDGHATVKLYQGRDAQGQIMLRGWTAAGLPAGGMDVAHGQGGGQEQEVYTLYCAAGDIVLLAPVIYIKCRL